MSNQLLEIKAAIQVQKPAREVFEAIADPEKMIHYFISKSTGRMEEGKNLVWNFPEFDVDVPVRIGRMEQDSYISYYWQNRGQELLVEMQLTPAENDSTLIRVTEKSMENNEQGLKWLVGNTEGWANFLACLKAYLEYGINLRKGAFDFLRKPKA